MPNLFLALFLTLWWQCYSNGLGNLGSVGSNKDVEPWYLDDRLRTIHKTSPLPCPLSEMIRLISVSIANKPCRGGWLITRKTTYLWKQKSDRCNLASVQRPEILAKQRLLNLPHWNLRDVSAVFSCNPYKPRPQCAHCVSTIKGDCSPAMEWVGVNQAQVWQEAGTTIFLSAKTPLSTS